MKEIAKLYAVLSSTIKAIESVRAKIVETALAEGVAEKVTESYTHRAFADADMVEVSSASVRVTPPKGFAETLPIPSVEGLSTGDAYDTLTAVKGAYERAKNALAETLKMGESFEAEGFKVTISARVTRKPKDGAEPTETETRSREVTIVHTARADRIRREHSGKPEA